MERKILYVILIVIVTYGAILISYNGNEKILVNSSDYQDYINQKATDYLISKANGSNVDNYISGNKREMYTFLQDTNNETEYRYIGYTPNNYVYFNCDDDSNTDTCEIWRIIGVFEVEDESGNKEKRLKIMKNKSIVKMAFDENEHNDWNNSTIKNYLNDNYFNTLSQSSKEMIGDAKYYLGPINLDSLESAGDEKIYNTNNIYTEERKGLNYSSSSSSWIGKIGLIYLSDYGHTFAKGVSNSCYNNLRTCDSRYAMLGWFSTGTEQFNWTLDLLSTDENAVGVIRPEGGVYFASVKTNLSTQYTATYAVNPTAYLKGSVYIQQGNGTKKNPYMLSLKVQTESKDNNDKYIRYKEYNIGDVVTYNGEKYYVIRTSSSKTSYVTLLKAEYLTVDELYQFGKEDIAVKNGNTPFYTNTSCNSDSNKNGCIINYNNSDIKTIVDNWSGSFVSDLVEVDGYKARLVTTEELHDYLGYDNNQVQTDESLRKTDDVPEWVYKYSCWTMSPYIDSLSQVFSINGSGSAEKRNVYSQACVRPVINLDKCALDGGCLLCKNGYNKTDKIVTVYKEFNVGDIITYKDSDYYVIKESSNSDDAITLLKVNPLTLEEVNTNGEGYINKAIASTKDSVIDVNGYGGVAFYSSELCNSIANRSGCKSDYKYSDVAFIVDSWSKHNLNQEDLKESSRLISIDDLSSDLGYSKIYNPTHIGFNDITSPSWIYSGDYSYWTMSPSEDSESNIWYISKNGALEVDGYDIRNFRNNSDVIYTQVIRPVITLYKTAINGGVWEEIIEVEDSCIEYKKGEDNDLLAEQKDNNTKVAVANTLSSVSSILLIISGLLVISGLLIYRYVYKKLKRNE